MDARKGGNIVFAVVLFFILLFAFTKFLGPIPFAVNNINTNNTDLFQATGTGKAASAPDVAKITLGVTESGSSILDVQSKVNTKTNSIINSLKSVGVDEKNIKTTNYSLNPSYPLDGGQKVTGYTVSQTLEIKVDIDKINQVIDGATRSGANIVGGVEFSLNDDRQLELENNARKEAVEKAKNQAQGLAKAAGIRLGKIINVTEAQTGIPRPVFLQAKTDQAQPDETTNITPGENNVEVTVTLTYQTL